MGRAVTSRCDSRQTHLAPSPPPQCGRRGELLTHGSDHFRRTCRLILPSPPNPPPVLPRADAAFPPRTLPRGRVAGVDEVGRGPLAGPVVAAAVVFPRACRAGSPACSTTARLTPEQRNPPSPPCAPRARRDRRRRRLGRGNRAAEHPARRAAGDVPGRGAAASAARSGAGRWRPAAAAGLRRCAAWSAATGCHCRSPPPRSSPRCCATGRWPGWPCASRAMAGTTNAGYATEFHVAALRPARPDPAPPAELRHGAPAGCWTCATSVDAVDAARRPVAPVSIAVAAVDCAAAPEHAEPCWKSSANCRSIRSCWATACS